MSIKHDIKCPCCENDITITIDPGEKATLYPPDNAHPGMPPSIDSIEGCECWHYITNFKTRQGLPAEEDYDERLFTRAYRDFDARR